MQLHRRRESITADEVIAKLRTFKRFAGCSSAVSIEAIIMVIEETVKALCKGEIEEEKDATRRQQKGRASWQREAKG